MRNNSIIRCSFPCTALLSLVSVAPCQEPTPAASATTPRDVAAAFRAVFGAESTCFTGKVSHESADTGDAGGVMIVVGGAGRAAEPFTGQIEVMRRDGRILVTSRSDLPGVVIFDDGTARITRVTTGTDDVDASTLAHDLPDLLQAEKLLREVEAAEWQIDERAADGGYRATTRLRSSLIAKPAGDQMLGFMQKRIDGIALTATLDAGGKLAAVEFDVARFDPNSEMRRRVIDEGLATGGGAVQLSPEDFATEGGVRDEKDLEHTIYRLQPAPTKTDERAQRLWQELVELARKDGF